MLQNGKYITAYGTGGNFKRYIREELLKIGKNLSPDLVDDVIKDVLLENDGAQLKDGNQGRDIFNYSPLAVEIPSSNGPSGNQLFEIHDSQSEWSLMVLTFCGTCWRSAYWSSNVMYSTYAVGTANGDEQVSISVIDENEENNEATY